MLDYAAMKYRTLLFDFDGTLSPTLDYWFHGFRSALGKLGIEVTDDEIFEKCFYKDDSAISKSFGLDSCAAFWSYTSESLKEQFETVELFAGVDQVLAHCEQQGIQIGLVTSGDRAVVEPALHRLGVHHHFDITITGNDITHYKPHPEPVLKALAGINAAASSTLFVGDHLVDVAAGKAAGTDTAVFYTETHSRFHKLEELKSAEPNFIFSDYLDLLARLT